MRDFSRPGRSLAYGTRGMIATSHPQASLAALDILKAGGSAVDAAIAASAVLCVVEPQSTGIGGDCFALVHRPADGLRGYNGSGRSPAALDPERFFGRGPIADNSADAVTVPGAVEAWQQLLTRYGRFDLDRLLRPAIALAEDGFAVTPRVASDWRREEARIGLLDRSRHQLTRDGKAPVAGDRWRFPELGAALRQIAGKGIDAFYRGAIAEDIVATLRAAGGDHSLDDLASHAGEWVTPIATEYAGRSIAELPPNGHGVTALIILNILRRLDDRGGDPGSARRYHLLLEAARLAYAVRDAFVADPAKAEVPVEHMLSEALADALAARIDATRRRDDLGPVPRPKASDTIYLCVVDGDGVAVSFINSVYWSFGSTIATPRTGIWLQNRGLGFNLQRGHPNAIAPGKRPLHTIIPGMALVGAAPEIVFGVMGGAYQPVGHATVVTGMLDFGLDPQQALDAPRVFFGEDGLVAEPSLPPSVARDLETMGHRVSFSEDPHGGGQIIRFDRARGVLEGGSDPRKDGLALGI